MPRWDRAGHCCSARSGQHQVGTLVPDRGHGAVAGVAAVSQHDGTLGRREPVEALGPKYQVRLTSQVRFTSDDAG